MEWSYYERERTVSGSNINSASVIEYGSLGTYSYNNVSWEDIQFTVNKGETKRFIIDNFSFDIYGAGYGDSGISTTFFKQSIIIDGVTVVDKNSTNIQSETIMIDNIEYTIEYTSKNVTNF